MMPSLFHPRRREPAKARKFATHKLELTLWQRAALFALATAAEFAAVIWLMKQDDLWTYLFVIFFAWACLVTVLICVYFAIAALTSSSSSRKKN